MKRWIKRALVVALTLGAMPSAWADVSSQGGQIIGVSSNPIQMIAVSSDTNSVGNFQAGSLILGVKTIATTGVGTCTTYDAATVAGGTNALIIDETSEATTGESNLQMWPMPYKVITDISIDVTTAVCIVYFQ